MKMPWHKEPANSGALARAVESLTAGDGPDPRADESDRGAAILDRHSVETAQLGDLAKLPPFRPVVVSLMRLFDSADVSAAEVAKLVESDAALCAELLAVVNSPLFALRQRVTSPSQAVSLLGLESTKSLATALGMRCLMQDAPRTPVVRRFWVHSLASATIAQQFAPLFRVNAHEAHISALLHDLGRLGLLAAQREPYTAFALTSHETTAEILAAEHAQFGMTHCMAGALLAQAWSLPSSVRRAVELHHEYGSDDKVVALVQLCCRLADDLLFPAVIRRDAQKPEKTIRTYVPEELRGAVTARLKDVTTSILAGIEALDF